MMDRVNGSIPIIVVSYADEPTYVRTRTWTGTALTSFPGVVPFIIGTMHTCNIFDITIIVVMSGMHVRIMCRCIT